MKKSFKHYQPDQMLLLPPSMRDWLSKDHLAYFINDIVEQLDLSAIYDKYKELRGQPPYSPLMMTKVLLYAFTQGIRSSRKIEKALHEDIAFRVISGNTQPDHWTVNDFRRRHLKALGGLFAQTVLLAQEAGLLKMRNIAIDGTKIKANASKHSAMSYSRMEGEIKRIQSEIEKYFEEADAIDKEEDEIYGDSIPNRLPEHLNTQQKRLKAIREAKRKIEEEAKKKAEQEQKKRKKKAAKKGKEYKPRKNPEEAEPQGKAQMNFTDPESRIMKNSDKAFVQAFNGQAAVDAATQIIVAADLTNQAADSPHLTSLVEQIMKNTGGFPDIVLGDAGYYDEDEIGKLEGYGIELLIPPNKVKHNEWKQAKAPKGRIPKDITPKERMRRKLKTKRGKEEYKLRMSSVEPVFGQIKENRGLRQFLLRGLEKVRDSWLFECAVHNILKLFRAGVNFQVSEAV